MLLLDGAFRALLLPPLLLVVISGASAVIVPPPTNLTVSCRNLNVTASWEFSRQQPPTVFRVHIGRTDESSVIKTTDHQYDLTGFIWSSESSYMDNFYVRVTAEQGNNQSEPVVSKTFSFNTLKTTAIQCELDFPPVDLMWKDSGATVSFRNPFHVYSLTANDPSAAHFVFEVSTNLSVGSPKTYSSTCTAKEETCKFDITFLGGVEECVTLDGALFDSIGVGHILFRKVEGVCVDEPAGPEDHLLLLLAVLLSVAALVVVSIIVCICETKAWTMKTSEDLPSPLGPVASSMLGSHYELTTASLLDLPAELQLETFQYQSYCRPDHRKQNLYNIVLDPDMVVVTLTGNHLEEEDKSTENLQEGGFCSDSEGGFSASSKREQEALMYGGNRTDDDSAGSSVKTECVSLQSDELGEEEQQEVEEEVELVPNYDRPQNLQMDNVQVDMGDGEMVTAYLGR